MNEWHIWAYELFQGKKKQMKKTHTNFGEKKRNYPKFEVRLVKLYIWC